MESTSSRGMNNVELVDSILHGQPGHAPLSIESVVGDYVACGIMPVLMRARRTHFAHLPAIGPGPGSNSGGAVAQHAYVASYDGTVHKVDSSGISIWTRQIAEYNLWCVAVDPVGYIYVGAMGGAVLKLSSDGTTAWSRSMHTEDVHGVAIDSSGNVYSAGWDATLHKLSSSGTSTWTYELDRFPLGSSVAIDAVGNIYCGCGPLHKLSSDGARIWTYDGHSSGVNGVAVDPAGYAYSVSWDENIRKVSPSGDCVGSYAGDPTGAWSVAVDPAGCIYFATGDSPGIVRKLSSTGSVVWSYTGHSSEVRSVATDPDGYVYSGSHDGTIRKITSSGTMMWSYNGPSSFGAEGVAVDPGCYGAFSDYW